MHTRVKRFWPISTLLLLMLTLVGGSTPALRAAPSQAVTPQDTPDVLVAAGVSNYAVSAPKLFWHTAAYCPVPIFGPNGGPSKTISPQAASDPEVISRMATYGSPVRQLFNSNPARAAGVCNPYHIRSNIVADDQYVYWVDDTGLVRLSTSANPGDPTELVTAVAQPTGVVMLAISASNIYVLTHAGDAGSALGFVVKGVSAFFTLPAPGNYTGALSAQDDFLYYVVSGVLHRLKPGTTDPNVTIASNVTGYYAEGDRSYCTLFRCYFANYVFFGQGRVVSRYDNRSGTTTGSIYTSSDSSASVYGLTSDGTNLFLFEHRQIPCNQPCFANYNDVLVRTARGGSSSGTPIYTNNSGGYPGPTHLTTDGTFLFWQLATGEKLLRLPNNAAALPQTNMRATGLEITQAIQSLNNAVPLVQNKRTFVRFYVQSDGPPVAGVGATLTAVSQTSGYGVTLDPVNSVGTKLTVLPTPNRNNLNDSFLFELPWYLTNVNDLQLSAVLNPYRVPLQQNYGNNTASAGPFAFRTSPRLAVQFVSWGYTLNNQTYYPRLASDIVQTYSWIRRAYPVASTPGFIGDPSPGFRPNLWLVYDDQLGARVNQTASGCTDNLCASAYTNAQMAALRTENGLSDSLFFYGMISDAGGMFPRGQACCGTNVSSGPAGIPGPTSLGNGWDTDGTYADWYAAHEIGHTLGRGHPAANPCPKDSKGNCIGYCNSVGVDTNFPYNGAAIGPADNTVEGFDVGDPDRNINIARAVYPSSTWTDVMSYCSNVWISDYTYNAMYDYMIAHPSVALRSGVRPQIVGDWLSVYGSLHPDDNTGQLHHVRHLQTVGSIPPRVPGPYSIRLLDGQGQPTDYPFTGDVTDDSSTSAVSFGQIVPFVAGTRTLQIVRNADNVVLVSQAINPNAPTITDVAIATTTSPVTGTVALNWTASDPDGAPLTFDVLYSRDQGGSFQPLKLHVTGTTTDIDTSRLGGGTAVLRVVASDGVNSAQSDTVPFTMEAKPPLPEIVTPGTNNQFHYGQLINFSGAAEDLQTGSVTGAGLQWSSDGSPIGTGGLLSFTDFKVGQHRITLTATNSAGLSARTSITITVNDDLNLPGPTLTVGPAQVGWQVEPGTTTAQTANLVIDNSGSGTVNWTAASDAPWLTLSVASGTAPGTLTLTGDPGGIAAGTTLVATVTINSPASGTAPAQQITIPVTLAAGNMHDPVVHKKPWLINLPLIIR